MNGIIIVNKEKGMTSHDVVSKLRRILKTKKVGHAGTLDPMASGVLVCLINQATKLSNFLVTEKKEYIATFKLGEATTTQDLEGDIIDQKEYQNDVSYEQLVTTLYSFLGKSIQTPSIYSAIKVKGKKLYEYARNNEEVEIPSREIIIYEMELLSFEKNIIKLRVKCSSGTYIRTLCYDIANKLNYPGVLIDLQRTEVGKFTLADSYLLDEIALGEYKVIDLPDAFDYPIKELTTQQYQDVRNGKTLEIDIETYFFVSYRDEIVALYQPSVNGVAKMQRGLWNEN